MQYLVQVVVEAALSNKHRFQEGVHVQGHAFGLRFGGIVPDYVSVP